MTSVASFRAAADWSDVDPLERLLRQQDLVVTRWQALRYLSLKTLRHRVEAGRWQRVRPGVFVAHNGPLTARQREWVVVLTAGADRFPDVGLAGLSALRQWGLRGVTVPVVDVVAPAGRRVLLPAGARFHRTTVGPDLVALLAARPAVTLPPRSLLDAAAWSRAAMAWRGSLSRPVPAANRHPAGVAQRGG